MSQAFYNCVVTTVKPKTIKPNYWWREFFEFIKYFASYFVWHLSPYKKVITITRNYTTTLKPNLAISATGYKKTKIYIVKLQVCVLRASVSCCRWLKKNVLTSRFTNFALKSDEFKVCQFRGFDKTCDFTKEKSIHILINSFKSKTTALICVENGSFEVL